MSKRKLEEGDHVAKIRRKEPQDDAPSVSSAQQPFEYQGLDLQQDTIRVLEILPGADGTLIECRIRNTSITEEAYLCLSYTWQPSNPHHDIRVDGGIMTVGENLYQFLYTRLNAGSTSEPFWIDALCIDQSIFWNETIK